ncbi:hypothetical protein AAF712_014290 [Marasmius tenuissimus]|uniref:Small heat shock protein n=1 Tax=Marasmius tenuissimus TaxID=585030 RepID=A0ABR2ZDJ6_9AGAR
MSYYYEPFYNFDRFFDEAFSPRNAQRRLGSGGEGDAQNHSVVQSIKPRMDLHEDGQTNTVTTTFELPGLKKEDVNIDVRDGRLTVSGETKISSDHEEDGYAIRERRFGRFARTLQLPKGVKEEEIKASLEDGVLTVTFPKSGKEAEPRRITIF